MSAWNYLKGYVIIQVEGDNLEKLLNLTTGADLALWDIKRQDACLRAKITTESLKKLRPLVKKTNCTVKVVKKSGFPFIVYRISRRQGLIAAVIFFLGLLYLLSSFVWFVDIQGNEKLPLSEVKKLLRLNGIYCGRLKSQINLEQAEDALLLHFPTLAWADVHCHGTKVEVRLKENTVFVREDKAVPCIVAARDGLITQLLVINGRAVAAEGDTVKKGQLLISGLKDEKLGSAAAEGKVKARVWSDVYLEGYTRQVRRVRTGQVKKSLWLKIGDKNYLLRGRAKSPYLKYEEEKRYYYLPEKWAFGWLHIKYYEIKEEYEERSPAELREFLTAKALELVKKQLGRKAEIISKSVAVVDDSERIPGLLRVKVTIEAIEDIAKSENLIFAQRKESGKKE